MVVERADAALTGGVPGDIERLAEGLRRLGIDGFFDGRGADFADGRVEEAGADGTVYLNYCGDPRGVAGWGLRGKLAAMYAEVTCDAAELCWGFEDVRMLLRGSNGDENFDLLF